MGGCSLGCRVRGGGWGGTGSLALLWAACPQSLRPPALCVKGLLPLPSLIPSFPLVVSLTQVYPSGFRLSSRKGKQKTGVVPTGPLIDFKHLVSPQDTRFCSQPPLDVPSISVLSSQLSTETQISLAMGADKDRQPIHDLKFAALI